MQLNLSRISVFTKLTGFKIKLTPFEGQIQLAAETFLEVPTHNNLLDLKLSPCSECCVLSSG